MSDPNLCFTWDTYQKNICSGLGLLQQKGEFVDMTLAADGHHVKVHQMVMSLVSPYIKELVTATQCPHPVIFLNKISHETLQSILEYAYRGEVMVPKDRFEEFLEACLALQIKGFDHDTLKPATDASSSTTRRDNITTKHFTIPEMSNQTESEKPNLEAKSGVKRRKLDRPNIEYHDVSTIQDDFDNGNDVAHNLNDDDTYDELDNETEVSQPNEQNEPTEKAKMPCVVQFSLSAQGSVMLVLNRFLYRLRHTRRTNERMWRCSDYKNGCPAFAVTLGDVVKERGCVHNHPFHDKQILKRVHTGNIFTAYNAVEAMSTAKKKSTPIKDRVHHFDDDDDTYDEMDNETVAIQPNKQNEFTENDKTPCVVQFTLSSQGNVMLWVASDCGTRGSTTRTCGGVPTTRTDVQRQLSLSGMLLKKGKPTHFYSSLTLPA